MRTHWWIPMMVACAVAVGCKKDPANVQPKDEPAAKTDEPAAPPTAPDNADEAPAADKLEARKPVVTLLQPGAEPRRELRYHVAEGDSYTLDIRMKMGMQAKVAGSPAPTVDIPAMLVSMKVTITHVEGDHFQYAYELTKADIDASAAANPMASSMKQALSPAVGIKGKASVNARGVTEELSLEVPDSVPAQAKQMVEGFQQSVDQLSAPLPEEPVGVGAKWQSDQVIAQNGITMKQLATFTITKLTDDGAELAVELTQEAPPQDVKTPGLPQSARLKSLKGSGSGTTSVHFDQLAPVKSSMELANQIAIDIKMGRASQSMSTDMTMAMTLEAHR